MAECPKCQNTHFECEMVAVKNLNFYVGIVKCNSCDTAIGVLDVKTADDIIELNILPPKER